MTYAEARVMITMLLVSKGKPAPDFSDDIEYRDLEDTVGIVLFYLSDSIKDEIIYGSQQLSLSLERKYKEAVEKLTTEPL